MVPQVSCFHFRSKHKTRNKCVQHFKLQVLRLQCLSKMDKHQQVTVTPTRIKTAKPLSFLTAPPPPRQVIEGSRELITQNQDDFELLLCRCST
jgi:hypothetical protein